MIHYKVKLPQSALRHTNLHYIHIIQFKARISVIHASKMDELISYTVSSMSLDVTGGQTEQTWQNVTEGFGKMRIDEK